MYDDYDEIYNDESFLKTEIVPGVFTQYTYKFLDKFITLLFIIFLCHSVNGHQRLTVGTGGGYSSNLYADSFGIGDSYMLGAISISDTSNIESMSLDLLVKKFFEGSR